MGAFLCWLGVRVLEMHRVLKPTGTLYLHCDSTAGAWIKAMLDAVFGRKNFRNEIIWRKYGGHKNTATRKFTTETDTILSYTKTSKYKFSPVYRPLAENTVKSEYKHSDEDGRRYAIPRGRKYRQGIIKRVYLDEHPGVAVGSLWDERGLTMQGHDDERTGYPTQKPLALYERIIKASSEPGDIVLDPFAGCATTCVAAERLGRQWVGIDLNEPAREVIHDRLQREVSSTMEWGEIVGTPNDPPRRSDDGDAVAPELRVVSRKRNARRLPVREIKEKLILSAGRRCQGCGWQPPYEDYLQVDHKKPRSLGGADDMDNLTLLCDPCNRFKSNKLTLTELRQARVDEGRVDTNWWTEQRWL